MDNTRLNARFQSKKLSASRNASLVRHVLTLQSAKQTNVKYWNKEMNRQTKRFKVEKLSTPLSVSLVAHLLIPNPLNKRTWCQGNKELGNQMQYFMGDAERITRKTRADPQSTKHTTISYRTKEKLTDTRPQARKAGLAPIRDKFWEPALPHQAPILSAKFGLYGPPQRNNSIKTSSL